MAQEQRQQINKTRINPVETGVIQSEVASATQMATIAPTKSKGMRMAEMLNLGVKTAGSIIKIQQDEKQKRRSILDKVDGTLAGKKEALSIIEQAEELPLEQRNDFLHNGLVAFAEKYKDVDISDSFLQGALTSFSSYASPKEQQYTNELATIAKNDLQLRASTFIEGNFISQESPHESIEGVKELLNVGNYEASKMYLQTMGAIIESKAKEDPTFNWKDAVDKYMKITSKDNVVTFTNHKDYKRIIQNTENALLSQSTQAYTQKQQEIKAFKQDVESNLIQMQLNNTPIVDQYKYLNSNTTGFTMKELRDRRELIASSASFIAPKSSDLAVLMTLKNKAFNGTLNESELLKNKEYLSTEDAKGLLSFSLTAKKELKTERVALAKDTFNKLLSVGKGALGGNKLMFNKQEGEDVQKYTNLMVSLRNDFLEENGWGALNTTVVLEWDKKAKAALDIKGNNTTPTTQHTPPKSPTIDSNSITEEDWNNKNKDDSMWYNKVSDWLFD